jgi:glucosamine--fructose-6-phosphate aminotransferase (isomerizing)
MSADTSLMRQEALESPAAVARFLAANAKTLQDLEERLKRRTPAFAVTSARGSSDNAAGFFKYLLEIAEGTPVASLGASVVSVYGARLKLGGALCLTISQSGKSPDIVALQDEAKRAGALTVALVNVADSPVGRAADICLPLCAGPERSVAATKSFIASLAGAAAIVAAWSRNDALKQAVQQLPAQLEKACVVQWPDFVPRLRDAKSLYVLGRGPTLPIAAEAALKLKETCALHAEAYSAAEVMHGPLELVSPGFPALAFSPDDAARAATATTLDRLRKEGAVVMEIGSPAHPSVAAGHALLQALPMIQTAYLHIEQLAQARGRNPDTPQHLKKVTETV